MILLLNNKSKILAETAGRINAEATIMNEKELLFYTQKMRVNHGQVPPRILCEDEESLNVLLHHIPHKDIKAKINIFKNKQSFREALKPIYPEFRCDTYAYHDLLREHDKIKLPVIVKPAKGLFSIGVYKVRYPADWQYVLASLRNDMMSTRAFFPTEVLDFSEVVVEEMIDGEEYAIDYFYDESGRPRILCVYKREFLSDSDLTQTAYTISPKMYHETISKSEHLEPLLNLLKINGMPMHLEIKIVDDRVVPIEINPLRFAGDIVAALPFHCLNINVYECYFKRNLPDWVAASQNGSGADQQYGVFIVQIPKLTRIRRNTTFDYDGFLSNFEGVIKAEKHDWHQTKFVLVIYCRVNNDSLTRYMDLCQNLFFNYFVNDENIKIND